MMFKTVVDLENARVSENDEVTVIDVIQNDEVALVEDKSESLELEEEVQGAASHNEVIDKTWACSFCDFKTKSERDIRSHLKTHENPCNTCGKNFSSVDFLEKHRKDIHEQTDRHDKTSKKSGVACRFWLKGICNRGDACRFDYERIDEEAFPQTKKCKFQDKCRYGVRCNFLHDNIKPCLYQERCRNERCIFHHFDNAKPFLGKPNLKSVRDFPPLRRHRVPVWV